MIQSKKHPHAEMSHVDNIKKSLRKFQPYFGDLLRNSSLTKKNDFLIKKCV